MMSFSGLTHTHTLTHSHTHLHALLEPAILLLALLPHGLVSLLLHAVLHNLLLQRLRILLRLHKTHEEVEERRAEESRGVVKEGADLSAKERRRVEEYDWLFNAEGGREP